MALLYIIGGGELGLPALKWAREEGLILAVTDKYPLAPGLIEADERFICSAEDVDGHLKFADTLHGHEVAGVISMASEGACIVRTVLQKNLGLEAPPMEAVLTGLDKLRQKKAMEAAGVPVARWASFENGFVKKPLVSSGSRGVEVFNEEAIVEERVEGRHIDVNGLFISGNFYPCGIGERYMQRGRHPVAVGGEDPAEIGDSLKSEAYALLEKASRAIGIDSGPVKGDLILGAEGFIVLETMPRFHGEIWTTWAAVHGSGVNAWKFYFRYLASGEIDESLIEPKAGRASWRICHDGLPDVKNAKRIMTWNRRYHAPVKVIKDNGDIPGYECWVANEVCDPVPG